VLPKTHTIIANYSVYACDSLHFWNPWVVSYPMMPDCQDVTPTWQFFPLCIYSPCPLTRSYSSMMKTKDHLYTHGHGSTFNFFQQSGAGKTWIYGKWPYPIHCSLTSFTDVRKNTVHFFSPSVAINLLNKQLNTDNILQNVAQRFS
jgi:hypothetical protein